MKKFTLLVLTLMMGLTGFYPDLNGQTKVFDQTITWEHAPYEYGGYGFYWWHRTDGYSNINYGDMPSDNWLSPNNYYGGEWTLSVEVISQPSNSDFWIQFGIWGDYFKGGDHTETVAGRQYVNGGKGSTGSYGLGSPSTWWNKQSGDHLDFSRADDFYRIGVVLWNTDPLCIPMGTDWNTSGCPEFADDFFPLTIKISVYASTGTYVPPPTVNPPNYSIDYWGERTDKVVSSEDQYSYDNFAGGTVYDGDGTYLDLTPGTNVYFRKKVEWGKKQTLTVPYRPGAPTFGIDYANQQTSETVSDSYKYSSNSDMSSSSTGNGSKVGLTPGSNTYFTKNANSGAFTSVVQELIVPSGPAAPAYGINYPNETSNTVVSSEYQHSPNSDMSSAIQGDGTPVDLTPGLHHYFRKLGSASAFPSGIQDLDVPARPAAPEFGIDYINSQTSSAVESTNEYSASANMSGAITGTGAYVEVVPGGTIYFRKKATSSSFISGIQTLLAPASPAAPAFLIDLMKEEISTPIGTGYVYGSNADMSDAIQGTDNILQVTPGVAIFFQGSSTASAFVSDIQMLASPARPAAPTLGIDFVNETTDIPITPEMQYSGSSGFESVLDGSGAVVDLIPGDDLYFRNVATASSFASEGFQLVVADRPVVSSTESGSTTLYPFLVDITFFDEVASLDIANISLVNAELTNLSLKSSGSNETVYQGLVFATAVDNISIMLEANAVTEGNFISSAYEVVFTGQVPGVGIESVNLNSFKVFPNPGKGIFHMIFENFDSQASYKVECWSITGKVVHTEVFYGTEDLRMDLSDLSDGFYLLRLSENDGVTGVVKLIIK